MARRGGGWPAGGWQDCLVVVVALSGLTGTGAACALGAFALLALGGKHVQRKQEQDDSAGNLEGGFGDLEIGKYSGAAQRKEEHD